ncbi:hypothetical protein K9L67_04335 [Candidatus Woesearchaeota archaeon]|nr:hypothetical protein [Candidatus Woesearchaeota archaeon]MCF8013027.1 hypothetical protein [Candidatus Woesearchaeota archaeon]
MSKFNFKSGKVKQYIIATFVVALGFFGVRELSRSDDFKKLDSKRQIKIISQENIISDTLKSAINLISNNEFDKANDIILNVNSLVSALPSDTPNKERLESIIKAINIVFKEYRVLFRYVDGETISLETYNALDNDVDVSPLILRWSSIYREVVDILTNMSESLKYIPDGHGFKKAVRNFLHTQPEYFLHDLRNWKTYCVKILSMDPGRKDVSNYLKLVNDVIAKFEKLKHV